MDSEDALHLAGYTNSVDFPLVDPLQSARAGPFDSLVARLAPGGAELEFSSLLGGINHDTGGAVAVDPAGNSWFTGLTASPDFPVQDPLFPPADDEDAYLVRIASRAHVATTPGPDPAAPARLTARDMLGLPIAGIGGTDFLAYAVPGFGANVGAARLLQTGSDDLLAGPGPSPVYGPHVRGFRTDGSAVAKVSFFAYGTLRFGVLPGGAGVDADAFDEVVTTPGPGDVFGPHVRGFGFDAATLQPLPGFSFYAYATLKYGASSGRGNVAAGAAEEVLTMPGPGPAFGPQVRGFAYDPPIRALAKVAFFAFSSPMTHGGRVDGADVDGDGWREILAGQGASPLAAPQVRGFDHDDLAVSAIPGLDVTMSPGMYGAEPQGGDLMGDATEDFVVAPGPDPSVPGRVASFDWDGNAVTPDLMDVVPFGSPYGVHAAIGRFSY